MNTPVTRTRGSFKFPKVDTVVSAAFLAVGLVGVLSVVVDTVASFLA